jgi:hypothetical protein
MEKKEGEGEGRLVSIYDQVNIDRLVTTSWLNTPAPLFIPPAVFSRMDVPQDYQVPHPANFFYLQTSYIFVNSRFLLNVTILVQYRIRFGKNYFCILFIV